MAVLMLERDEAVSVLHHAVGEAAAGRGAVVLVAGEAGIGKTSLMRAFAADAHARVLFAACDDLRAPRPLGPLRDAIALGASDDVFAALLGELARDPPTLLVVEDVHWADDATLDAVGYAARRIESLPAVLVLTFRDDAQRALARLLGVVAGTRHHRLALTPLSREAVEQLSAGSGADGGALHRITGGNPFFVTEVLAAPPDHVPASVADAVLARVHRLSDNCRAALEQLSVMPWAAGVELFGSGLDALTEAEAAGVVVAGPQGLGFRHEIARRAVEQSLPALRRRALNQAVVRELRRSAHVDVARLMHHAAEAGDQATILEFGLRAAREASAAGSHRQALVHLEMLRPHGDALPPRDRAEMLDEYGSELYNAHRFADAVRAGRAAADAFSMLHDDAATGRCLVRLSRHLLLLGETEEAEYCAQRAVETLELAGSDAERADALVQRGAILAMMGAADAASSALEVARRLAGSRADVTALCLNYLGIARNDPRPLCESIATARAARHDEYTGRGYTNLAEVLALTGALDELDACAREGLEFTRERGFWSHAYILEAHRCVVLLRRGQWDEALSGLRALVDSVDDPGIALLYSVPWYARLLARRGEPAAGPLLAEAWERAQRQGLLVGLSYAGLAYADWAWLTGRTDVLAAIADTLLPRLAAQPRDELSRYLARAGLPGHPDLPAPDDDPYERALELADTGERQSLLDALATLERLRAEPAADWVRARLRANGIRFRRPQPQTRVNPAGLTARQLDVLALLGEARTNAEIATALSVSVRTVDHHVAAVLDKLGVRSRRDAATAARRLGIK